MKRPRWATAWHRCGAWWTNWWWWTPAPSDGTVALARVFGARIGRFPWRDDFAAARNESLRLCTGDWVLLLDADEAVDPLDHGGDPPGRGPGGAAAAFTLVSRNYTRDGSARLFDQPVAPNRSRYSEGADLPFYFDQPILRLVRRFPDLRFEGRIHERLDACLQRKHLPVGALGAVIHHFGKLDQGREKAKAAYYLRLAEQEAQEHPRDPNRQFNLMAQAEVAGSWETALRAGLAFLRHSPTVPSTGAPHAGPGLSADGPARGRPGPPAADPEGAAGAPAGPLPYGRLSGSPGPFGRGQVKPRPGHGRPPGRSVALPGPRRAGRAGRPAAGGAAGADGRRHLPARGSAPAPGFAGPGLPAAPAGPGRRGRHGRAAGVAGPRRGRLARAGGPGLAEGGPCPARPGGAGLGSGDVSRPPGAGEACRRAASGRAGGPPLSKQTAADTGSGAGSGARKTCG